jgi:hypothetical protein
MNETCWFCGEDLENCKGHSDLELRHDAEEWE